MRSWMPCLAVALLCAAGDAARAADDKIITYKWVDENGITHYGDRIPPQYAKKETSVLNSQGVEIKRNDAQKTPEQIAEELRQQEAALRQKQHDNFLLTTYPNVKDIEALRDERVTQISGQRRAAESYIESLHARLTALQTRALTFKPYNERPTARRMPDDLAEDLMRTLNEMRTQKLALVAKDAEETALRAEFQADIDRYKELRAIVRSR